MWITVPSPARWDMDGNSAALFEREPCVVDTMRYEGADIVRGSSAHVVHVTSLRRRLVVPRSSVPGR